MQSSVLLFGRWSSSAFDPAQRKSCGNPINHALDLYGIIWMFPKTPGASHCPHGEKSVYAMYSINNLH